MSSSLHLTQPAADQQSRSCLLLGDTAHTSLLSAHFKIKAILSINKTIKKYFLYLLLFTVFNWGSKGRKIVKKFEFSHNEKKITVSTIPPPSLEDQY